MSENRTYRVAVLSGDGVGPEVISVAIELLEASAEQFGFAFDFRHHLAGGRAIDEVGEPLPPETLDAALEADAVLLGAVGGPRWDGLQGNQRPERGLLALRKGLDVFANLRPVAVPEALAGSSPLRAEAVAGTDMLIVRELTSGIYFGASTRGEGPSGAEAADSMSYSEAEIVRVARVAFREAISRRGSVTSVDKSNVLEVSRLWREVVTGVHREEFPEVTLDHLYVDNAAMQIVLDPRRFDVVLTGNLFGDILSDLAAALPGSLGMLPSASIGGATGLYEPVHGSAPDIAGKGLANPCGAILSAAMMLRHLGEQAASVAIQRAVWAAIRDGLRTADLCRPGEAAVSTSAMAEAVLGRLDMTGGRTDDARIAAIRTA